MEPTLQVDDRVLVLKNTFIETDISSGDIAIKESFVCRCYTDRKGCV